MRRISRDNGKKPGTIRSDNSRIKLHIKPKLGHFKVASITSEQIEDFMRSLSAGVQSSQRLLARLLGKQCLRGAVKRKLRLELPIAIGIEKPSLM